MWTHRTLAGALASLALWGYVTAAAAVRDEVDRFDARRDRDARVTVPRTAAGAIDVPRLIVEIRAALTRGARDIRFRDTALSAKEARTLRELGARFGFERVRIREDGHRVRVEFHDGDRDDGTRADVHRDARDDLRTRVDPRRPERVDRAGRADRPERRDRPERADGGERGDRPDRSGRH